MATAILSQSNKNQILAPSSTRRTAKASEGAGNGDVKHLQPVVSKSNSFGSHIYTLIRATNLQCGYTNEGTQNWCTMYVLYIKEAWLKNNTFKKNRVEKYWHWTNFFFIFIYFFWKIVVLFLKQLRYLLLFNREGFNILYIRSFKAVLDRYSDFLVLYNPCHF